MPEDAATPDSFSQYLRELSECSLLTPERETEYARRAQAGDEEAVQELVRGNLRFVVLLAKGYQNRGLSLADLVQEGNIGLLQAARRFDPDHGVKFITYAVAWVRQAIRVALARDARAVRLPLHRVAEWGRISRAASRLAQELGREATPEEVADAAELSAETVYSLLVFSAADLELDAPTGDGGSGPSRMEKLLGEAPADAGDRAERGNLAEHVRAALATLPERDATVLRLLYGLEGETHTLAEIAVLLGVSRQRVDQLHGRALARLRNGEMREVLASLLDDVARVDLAS